MNREEFLKRAGRGTIGTIGLISVTAACGDSDEEAPQVDPEACSVSPAQTAGPFPIKSPTDFIRENIIGDRTGIPLTIRIKVENTNNNCAPLAGALVDVWHCDAQGNYSEYNDQLDGNFTGRHFLRGRQTTNSEGVATFISIYPGWYPGRAPHLHLEILSSTGSSLLITQTAFPEDVSKIVYGSSGYNGVFDTSNAQDGVFDQGLEQSLATSVVGNSADGYVLNETIKVAG